MRTGVCKKTIFIYIGFTASPLFHWNPNWFYLSGACLPRMSWKKKPLNGSMSAYITIIPEWLLHNYVYFLPQNCLAGLWTDTHPTNIISQWPGLVLSSSITGLLRRFSLYTTSLTPVRTTTVPDNELLYLHKQISPSVSGWSLHIWYQQHGINYVSTKDFTRILIPSSTIWKSQFIQSIPVPPPTECKLSHNRCCIWELKA